MNIESSELSKQLHCYRKIHMYDFHDDAGHHHGSQYKQIISYKPSLGILTSSWSLLETFAISFRETLLFWTLG